MSIALKSYKTLDFAKTRIPDCLVKNNKIGGGNGEAKLYVGGSSLRDWAEFFGNFNLRCFFDKHSLKQYLLSVEFEYKYPSQVYRKDISGYWQRYCQELDDSFPEMIYFKVFHKEYDNRSRFYIQSRDRIYDFLRRIALPNITTLLIQKIFIYNEVQLWFRLYLNDIGNELDREIADENVEEIKSDMTISSTEKERIIKARVGQGYYRDLIIEKYRSCVITGIDDERVLIASHIKPWISSNNSERISRHNGLLLSPMFDKLFDRGFISFKDNGTLMLSNHFSDANFNRAGLAKDSKYNIGFTSEMKPFLDFHRDTIFLK